MILLFVQMIELYVAKSFQKQMKSRQVASDLFIVFCLEIICCSKHVSTRPSLHVSYYRVRPLVTELSKLVIRIWPPTWRVDKTIKWFPTRI